MREMKVVVSDALAASLQKALHAVGLSEAEFLQNALIKAVVEARPEYERPIQSIRAYSSYAGASEPFLITGIARSNDRIEAQKFDMPIPMTVSRLTELQNRGATHVSVQFNLDSAPREPDFPIRELLGES